MKDDHKFPEDQLKDFPSFRMSESTQAHMHEQILASIEGIKRQPRRNRQLMNKFRIGFLTAAALVIFSILSFNAFNPNFNSGNEDAPVTSEPEVVPEDDLGVEPTPDETDENTFDPMVFEEMSTNILQALYDRDMATLASYVHSEKGVLFSPYYSVSESTVEFEQSEISTLLDDPTEYLWGYGEANTEIRLTPAAYFEKHMQVERFFEADRVLIDTQNEQIDPAGYLKSVFPGAKIVEYYDEGTAQYSNLDWRSLNLVFEQDVAGEWKIVAIVNNLFTP